MGLINTQLGVSVNTTLTASQPISGATPNLPLPYQYALGLGSGTGSGQADKLWVSGARTLAASSTEDLDLAGTLLDAFGAAITFARIKGIVIASATGNTNDVVVGGAASNGFISWVGSATDKVKVKPGGCFALFAQDAVSYAVTSGTADLLRVGNGGAGTPVTYDIVVIGSSA